MWGLTGNVCFKLYTVSTTVSIYSLESAEQGLSIDMLVGLIGYTHVDHDIVQLEDCNHFGSEKKISRNPAFHQVYKIIDFVLFFYNSIKSIRVFEKICVRYIK